MMLLLSLVVGELQDKVSQLDMFSEFTLTHVEPLAKYAAPPEYRLSTPWQ